MNRFLSKLIFILLLTSCSNESDIKGYWRLEFDEQFKNHFLPYELSFKQDTLIIVDGYNFKQSAAYTAYGDSISITFTNGVKRNYFFSVQSDSTIQFAGMAYSRTSKDYFSSTQSYELLGWPLGQEFSPQINSTTIHLIKDGDSTKVILNDATTGLNDIPYFLIGWHGQQPQINLYVGQGIELKDLLVAYCWIKYSGCRKIELVTSNISFEKFYSIYDYVDVDDSLFMKFLEDNSLPPPPPQPESNGQLIEVFINSQSDFILRQPSDSVTYRYNFSCELGIKEYLELTEKLNNSEKKKIKRLSIPHKRK